MKFTYQHSIKTVQQFKDHVYIYNYYIVTSSIVIYISVIIIAMCITATCCFVSLARSLFALSPIYN